MRWNGLKLLSLTRATERLSYGCPKFKRTTLTGETNKGRGDGCAWGRWGDKTSAAYRTTALETIEGEKFKRER